MALANPTVSLPSGRAMPTFGVGTWRMGESARGRAAEVEAVRAAIERGITLIDTAEMYGDGEAETIVADAMGARRDGLFIVSNFDIDDMRELAVLDTARECATNQVLYNLTRRGIEFDLMPFCAERNMSIMAYSPLEQARMLGEPALKAVAQRHGATPAQVALAWLIRQKGVVTIPKATRLDHLDDNIAALDLTLRAEDLKTLDTRFPPPKRATPLDML